MDFPQPFNNIYALEYPVDPVVQSRHLCADHIAKFYPMWKQINVIRSGDTAAIQKMSAFIDACRDWSNHSEPKFEDLIQIAP
jgi:hypothetical protein